MQIALAVLLSAVGVLHLQRVARGVRPWWALCVASGGLLLAAAVMLWLVPRWWWLAGLLGVIASQAAIHAAWKYRKVGTVLDVVLLLGIGWGFASSGPRSFQAAYERDAAERVHVGLLAPKLVTEAELAPLPEALQRYLRAVGAVGRPHVEGFSLRFTGRFRQGQSAPWMTFVAEQTSTVQPAARFFLMKASRSGIPMEALHRYADGKATMQVKVLSAVTVIDASGPQMDHAETVTVFNDLCIFAPAALVDLPVTWEALDARHLKGSWAGISAVLTFDETGLLVDFQSDDRLMSSADGSSFSPQRWSTPISEYAVFDGVKVMKRGAAVWKLERGDFTYGEFQLEALHLTPAR